MFSFIILTEAEASDLKFGVQLGFAKAHHKTDKGKKWAWPWAREALQSWGFPFIISAMNLATWNLVPKLVRGLDLPRPIIETHQIFTCFKASKALLEN